VGQALAPLPSELTEIGQWFQGSRRETRGSNLIRDFHFQFWFTVASTPGGKTHFSAETGIQHRRAETLSNYFDLEGLPGTIYIHALTPGCARADLAESLTCPAIVQGDTLIAFAPADDFAGELGDGRIWNSRSVKLDEFLPDQKNRNHIYMLLRLAFEKMAESKGLKAHLMSVGKAFWFAKDQVLSGAGGIRTDGRLCSRSVSHPNASNRRCQED
jgi:hypothetical protein